MDLRYIGNNIEIEPINVPIHTTFVVLLNMIYVVGNDRTVACMLAVPSKYGMSLVQLFIEQTPNHYHLSNEMDHFTRLSACDTDVDDENERDEEDDRNDAINTNEIHLSNDDENCCERENIDLVMVQQIVECENTRYVNLEVGYRSNNPEVEYEVENTSPVASPHGTQVNISNDNLEATFALVSCHMPPTQQFLNMDGAINCVFIVRREHGASRLASDEEFTPYIEAKIKAKVVKAGYYTTRAYLSTWAPLFYPIFDELEWPQYNGPIIVSSDSMKRLTSGRPKSSRLHNEMDARETRTPQTCGLCKQSDMDTRLFPARPNPKDTSVLTFQHQHQSSTIRVDPDMGHVLTCRHRFCQEWVLDDRVQPFIIQSRFYVFHRVGHVKVDWPLITALVERWLPETHTFHMLVDIDWHALCEELLGVRQIETDIHGASLRVRFITTHFSHLPPGF
uniref:Serine/threonine-protein phosphatase 7 long form-like n=1 Tax=Vitis vinifera TaxID=29760 RepID=A5C5X7_VITVI|nr:hypothetical protein VITISV_002621 [Vitis vinifera]